MFVFVFYLFEHVHFCSDMFITYSIPYTWDNTTIFAYGDPVLKFWTEDFSRRIPGSGACRTVKFCLSNSHSNFLNSALLIFHGVASQNGVHWRIQTSYAKHAILNGAMHDSDSNREGRAVFENWRNFLVLFHQNLNATLNCFSQANCLTILLFPQTKCLSANTLSRQCVLPLSNPRRLPESARKGRAQQALSAGEASGGPTSWEQGFVQQVAHQEGHDFHDVCWWLNQKDDLMHKVAAMKKRKMTRVCHSNGNSVSSLGLHIDQEVLAHCREHRANFLIMTKQLLLSCAGEMQIPLALPIQLKMRWANAWHNSWFVMVL